MNSLSVRDIVIVLFCIGVWLVGRVGGNDPIIFNVIIFQHTHVFVYRYIRYIVTAQLNLNSSWE